LLGTGRQIGEGSGLIQLSGGQPYFGNQTAPGGQAGAWRVLHHGGDDLLLLDRLKVIEAALLTNSGRTRQHAEDAVWSRSGRPEHPTRPRHVEGISGDSSGGPCLIRQSRGTGGATPADGLDPRVQAC